MSEEKKTEEQLRHDIRRKFSFSENGDKKRIDEVLKLKKDKYQLNRQKKELEDKAKSDDPQGNNKPQGNQEPQGEQTLSAKDAARLQEGKIAVDDWDDVLDYVDFKKKTDPDYDIKKALTSPVVKATLAEKAEQKKSSNAIQTKKRGGGSSKISGKQLLDKALKTGELPETDEEMEAMIDARQNKSED